MRFIHKCHGVPVQAFRFGVHQTPAWFFEALEKGDLVRNTGIGSGRIWISAETFEPLLGQRFLADDDWLVRSEDHGLFASVSQEDFLHTYQSFRKKTDEPPKNLSDLRIVKDVHLPTYVTLTIPIDPRANTSVILETLGKGFLEAMEKLENTKD